MAMTTLGQTVDACTTLPPVSTEYARLCLEVAPGVNPITGRLSDAHGAWTAFEGWAQFVRAIEQAASVQLDQVESEDHPHRQTPRRSS